MELAMADDGGVKTRAPRRRMVVSDTPVDAKDPASVAFAKNLNRLMLERGWRQRDVIERGKQYAPDGKFGRHLMSSWLNGKHVPNPFGLNILSKVFGVKIAELVPPDAGYIVDTPKHTDVKAEFLPGGMTRLRIDMALPSDVAMKIIALTQAVEQSAATH